MSNDESTPLILCRLSAAVVRYPDDTDFGLHTLHNQLSRKSCRILLHSLVSPPSFVVRLGACSVFVFLTGIMPPLCQQEFEESMQLRLFKVHGASSAAEMQLLPYATLG